MQLAVSTAGIENAIAIGRLVNSKFPPIIRQQSSGLRYHSVRYPGGQCWALMTPRSVTDVVQTAHLEMIWNGAITQVNQLRCSPR